jgi:hypothetical protein
VPALAAYHEAHELTVTPKDGGEAIQIVPKMEPDLRVELSRTCSMWTLVFQPDDCDQYLRTRLYDLRYDGESLILQHSTSRSSSEKREVRARPDEVVSAALLVDQFVSDDWRPTFGIGLGALGAHRAIALTFQWLPAEWVAIEAGMLPAAHAGIVSAGLRIGPWEFATIRPFIGGFANIAFASGAGAPPPDRGEPPVEGSVSTVAGGRVGVDWNFGHRRWMLTAEFNMTVSVDDGDGFIGAGDKGEWRPWGGGAISYMFH